MFRRRGPGPPSERRTVMSRRETWLWREPNTSFKHLEGVTALRSHKQDAGPDRSAGFEDLYRQTYGGMLTLAVATVSDRAVAEDLVQDAYAQLWNQWTTVAQPAAWLRRAVVSNCLASLRTQRRRAAIIRRQPLVPAPAPPDDAAFLDLLVGLNERQRIAVTLRYVHDLSEAEIASVLGCRPGTVKSTLHRAKAVLHSQMRGEPS